MRWGPQLRERLAWLTTTRFWYTFLGVTLALLVWFYMLYLAIDYFDRNLSIHATLCGAHEQRNWHYLTIILLTPIFLVGLLGVIGEWMQFVENRHKGRKAPFKHLILFLVLMQVTGLAILIAMDC